MKRFLLLLFTFIFIFCFSFCEAAGEYNLNGEWYVEPLREDLIHNASIDDQGNFHFTILPNVDDYIKWSGEFIENGSIVYTCEHHILSDDVHLFDVNYYGGYIAHLFVFRDNEWKEYTLLYPKKYLFYNGTILCADRSGKLEYYLIDDKAIFIEESGYQKSHIISYGNDVFLFVIDDFKEVKGYKSDSQIFLANYPMYICVRTDFEK